MMHRKQGTGEITGLTRQSLTQSLLSSWTVSRIHRTLMVLVPLPPKSNQQTCFPKHPTESCGAKHANCWASASRLESSSSTPGN